MRPRKFGDSVPKNQPLSESDRHEYEPRPATDRLAVLGVGSAVVAFLLWAFPVWCGSIAALPEPYCQDFFSTERLPFVAAFFALAVISLLLRRR